MTDPLKMLESLSQLDPDVIKGLIRELELSGPQVDLDSIPQTHDYETLDIIEKIANEWWALDVDDATPADLFDAYVRFNRAWNSYHACVVADMIGEICRKTLRRTDHLGLLIDEKLHNTRDLYEQIHLMNMFRLLIPQYIDVFDEERSMKYEKNWNKWLAERIIKSGTLDNERAELLIRVREDFKRLPAPMSKFIRNDLQKFLAERVEHIKSGGLKDELSLKDAIQAVDNYIQLNNVSESVDNRLAPLVSSCVDLIAEEMAGNDDIQTWPLYCNLLVTGFSPLGTVKDRKVLMKRVEDRLKKFYPVNGDASKPDGQDATKDLTNKLLLASMYLENMFLEDQGCDIYTSYWVLSQQQ